MKRTVVQNNKLYWLLENTNTSEQEKRELVRKHTANRTHKSSEMNQSEMGWLLYELQEKWQSMNQMRRKIFAMVTKIKLADEVLSESEVLRYIHNIVGLNLPKKGRLNAYTKNELHWILQKLDVIAIKQQAKYRKSLKPQA